MELLANNWMARGLNFGLKIRRKMKETVKWYYDINYAFKG